MKSRTFLALVSLFLPASTALAQAPQTTFRPSLIESFATSYSYSGKSGYKHNEAAGETSVQHADASISGRIALGRATFLNLGAAVSLNTIESDATVPVPEKLGELTLNAGVTRVFSPKWRASFFVRPGYYGDFENYTSRTLNVPAIAMAMYAPSQRYMWIFGLSVNPFAEYPVMPVVTMRWAFAEDWALNLGFPRLGVTWQATKSLELSAHGTAQGGGFRVTKSPGSGASARADLVDTYVNYREIRVGMRATYKFSAKTSLGLEGGWMAERRFDYYDRDYELKGKPSAYVTVALDVKL